MAGKIFIFLLVAVILWLYIRYFEKKSIFYPTRQIEFTPVDAGVQYENIYFDAKDGVRLNGWFVPAKNAAWTVLFFHGNAGNISHRIDMSRLFNEEDINILLVDYRGYGKSKGVPSEKGLYLDARAAHDYLLSRKDVNSKRIAIFGESLGGAVAIDLAAKAEAAALICESTFTSAVDMSKVIYPMLPAELLVTQRFDSISKIKGIRIPTLIMHSKNDEMIPFSQGKRLFEASCAPQKRLYIMQGGHNEAKFTNQKEFITKIVEFLEVIK